MTTYKRGGSWYFRFWSRKRLFETGGFRSKRRAMEAEWERRREVGASSRGKAPAPITFAAALDRYLAEGMGHHLRADVTAYEKFREFFSDQTLSDLRAADLKAYRQWRKGTLTKRKKPPKGSTVNRELTRLSGLFSWAQTVHLVYEGFNPATSKLVKREAEDWRPWVILSDEQERALFDYLPPRERKKAILLKNMGVRKGVILNLHWEQIDWRHRLATYTSKGKSDVIPLNKTVIAVLKSLDPKLTGRVFAEKTDISFRRAWGKARKAIGLPNLRPHDLRVTFARQLDDKGVSLKTIQGLLGHSTPTMTLRYITSDMKDRRRAVDQLDEDPPDKT